MIEALVFLAAVTLTALTASVYTRRKVTKEILASSEEIATAAARDLMEELLNNPDTREDFRRVIKNYIIGRKGFKIELDEHGKPTGQYVLVLNETPDLGVGRLPNDTNYYDYIMDGVKWMQEQFPGTGFHDGQTSSEVLTDEGFEKWLDSYDRAVVSGTSK